MNILKTAMLTVLLSLIAVSALGDKPDENSPWRGAVTFCDADDLSVTEIRQMCEDFWFYYQGLEIIPPVVVTFCPPDHATDNYLNKGKKPAFTPNWFCPLVCDEGETEVTCSVMRWKNTEN